MSQAVTPPSDGQPPALQGPAPIQDPDAYFEARLKGEEGLVPVEPPPVVDPALDATPPAAAAAPTEEPDDLEDDEDEAEAAPADGKAADDASSRGKRRNRRPASVRIAQAVALQKIAEREAQDHKARVDALEREVQALKTPAPAAAPTPAFTEPKPKFDDFANEPDPDDAFDEAKYQWRQRRDAAAAAAARTQAESAARIDADAARTAAERAVAAHTTRLDAFKQAHPDFDAKLAATTSPMSRDMGRALIDHADGPAIAYYLADHPEVAAKVAAQTGDALRASLDVLAGIAATTPSTPRVETASAPSGAGPVHSAVPSPTHVPIAPVGTGSRAAAPATAPEHEDPDAYVDRRFRELNAARGR